MNPMTVWGIPLDPELRISVIRKGIPTIFTLADAFPSSSITVAQLAWRSGLQTQTREYESGCFLCQPGCGEAEMDKLTDPAYLPAYLPPASSVWSKTETLSGNSWLISKGNSIVYPNKLHRFNNKHKTLLFFYESGILLFFFGLTSWCKLRCSSSPPSGQEGFRHAALNDNFI